MYKDPKKAPEACKIMKITAQELKGYCLIDGIIPEGSRCFAAIDRMLTRELGRLSKIKPADLIKLRYEKWTAKGHEAHDLRKGFGIEKPYKVPFNAEYTYEGRDENSGLYKIRVRYTMYMENPPLQN